MIEFSCPKCGRPIRVPDAAAGQSGQCKNCGTSMTAPRPENFGVQPIPPTEVKVEVHPQPAKASSLGIGSIILGILALSVAWVPWFGLYASPLGVLGLILGVIGFVVAMWRSGSGIGFAIAGSAISALALFIGYSVNRDIVIAGYEQAQAAIRRSQQRGDEEDLQQNELGAANDEIAVANADPWDNATTVAEDDTVRVEVVSAEIGRVKSRSFGEDHLTEDNWLKIVVRIQNRTESKKFRYMSWCDSGDLRNRAKLTDDLDNKYSISYERDIVGRTTIESVYPDKTITDLLVFEIPVDKAKFLKLALPKNKCEAGDGEFLLKIPMRLLARESISEKKLPAIPDNGHKQEAKKNQVVIDVDGAEPLDEVLTILVADRSYAVWRMTPEVTGYFLAEFDELVRLARNAKPNDDGVRVRILRSESAKVSAWQKLQTELVQAGIPAEAIVLTKDLVVMSVRKGTSMRGE